MQYLEIKNPDLTAQAVPLSNRINSIDSINVQKTFLRVALEFFYLQDNDELSDTQEDFLNCFPLKKETAAEIESEVSRLFIAVGAEGIAEKYGYVPLEEPEIAEQSEIPCESDEETLVSRAEPEIGVGADISRLEEITLSGIIHINQGETCTYKNKIIHFQASMECEGTLEFDTCILHYGEVPDVGQIVMTETSVLSVNQCTIENHSFENRMFIDAFSIYTGISFTNCEFLNCASFLRTERTLVLDSCGLKNPGINFISSYEGDVRLTNCNVSFRTLPDFLLNQQSDSMGADYIISCQYLHLFSCDVKGSIQLTCPEDFQKVKLLYVDGNIPTQKKIALFGSSDAIIKNCAFHGIANIASRISEVSLSTFEHCTNLFGDSYGEIKECRFDKCSSIGIGVHDVQNCQFNNCYGELFTTLRGATFESCEFNNWLALEAKSDGVMLDFHGSFDSPKSILKECVFNGIKAHGWLLVRGRIWEYVSSPVLEIQGCSFMNCTTEHKSKKLIKEDDYYYCGLLKKNTRTLKTVDISNCTGLDQVNTGTGYNEHVTLKTHTNGGIQIGVPDR